MSTLNISATEILDEINKDIPFNNLIKNKGIYETRTLANSSISIGLSYEDEDEKEVYIYNVFVEDQYINISGRGNKKDILPDAVINEILSEISDIEV